MPAAAPDVCALTGGPDAYGYTFIDSNEAGGPPYSWVDISGTGTSLSLGDDDIASGIPIGFTFNFYGSDYTPFWVSENGRIMCTEPASAYSLPTATVPSATLPHNYIAPFWDNLAVDGTGNILYATIGAAPP